MVDFSRFDDEQLDALRVDVLTEQERRANLAQIPAQVTELAKTYRAGGGDEDALIQAISHTPEPAEEDVIDVG